jgi:hypothetical protein
VGNAEHSDGERSEDEGAIGPRLVSAMKMAPRGWKVDDRGKGSLVRSFDRLVALSIVPDRSHEALEVPDGAEVRATGRQRAGSTSGCR